MVRPAWMIGFAVILFFLGTLSGRFVFDADHHSRQSAVTSDVKEAPSPTPLPNVPATNVGDSKPALVQVDSAKAGEAFAEFAEQASNIQLAAHAELKVPDASAVERRSTATLPPNLVEQTIRRYFPDLEDDVMSGWVEAYSDLSQTELEALLEQKRTLPSIMPANSYLLTPPATLEQPTGTRSVVSGHHLAVTRLQQNLSHAMSPGYRRWQVTGQLTSIGAEISTAWMELNSSVTDFRPADIENTGIQTHLAIEGRPNLMFRMEPTTILTRCGRFERLADGRLGMSADNGSFALHGDIRIPDGFLLLNIGDDGTVQYRGNPNSDWIVAGQLQLADVASLSSLRSANGVFFKISEQDQPHLRMVAASGVRTAALEKSNVDPPSEWRTLEHLQKLSEF